jgi:hypothetical protein
MAQRALPSCEAQRALEQLAHAQSARVAKSTKMRPLEPRATIVILQLKLEGLSTEPWQGMLRIQQSVTGRAGVIQE